MKPKHYEQVQRAKLVRKDPKPKPKRKAKKSKTTPTTLTTMTTIEEPEPSTTSLPPFRRMPPSYQSPSASLQIQRRPRVRVNMKTTTTVAPSTTTKMAEEVEDLTDDEFFFNELAKTKPPPPKRQNDDDVEIYHRPNVDKGVVFVQQPNDGNGKRLQPDGRTKASKPKAKPKRPPVNIDYDSFFDAPDDDDDDDDGPKEELEDDAERNGEEIDESGYGDESDHEEDMSAMSNESSGEFEEFNADFEIEDDENDRKGRHVDHEIIEFRDPNAATIRNGSSAKQAQPKKKIRGKHYVRRFESPKQLYAELHRIMNDEIEEDDEAAERTNGDGDEDDDFWEVRIEKPHRRKT